MMAQLLQLLLGSALPKAQPTKSDLSVGPISRAGSSNACLKPVFLDVHALQPFGAWGPLPKDIWQVIFGFMEVKQLRRLLFVNRSFAKLATKTFQQIKKTRPDVRSIRSAKWTLPCEDHAALAIYPNGDLMLVITQESSSKLMIFDADFKIVKHVLNPKPLKDTKVQCCAIAPDGRHFFADHKADHIIVTDADVSKRLATFKASRCPWGMEVDRRSNELIIADSERNRVAVYDFDGKFLRSFGEQQLSFPNQMHLDTATDVLTVVEMNNNRLQRFSYRAGTSKEIILKGNLSCPCGVEIDNTGRIYVADCHNHRVVVYEPSGQMVCEFRSTSIGEGRTMRGPHRIRMRDDGTLIVKDWDAFYAF